MHKTSHIACDFLFNYEINYDLPSKLSNILTETLEMNMYDLITAKLHENLNPNSMHLFFKYILKIL